MEFPVFKQLSIEQKAQMYDRLSNEIDNIMREFESQFPPPPPAKTNIAMLTISPPLGTDFKDLKKLTERFVGWKGILDWMYSYELRPNDSQPHSHIVIRSDDLKKLHSEFKRQMKKKDQPWNYDFQYRTMEPNDWSKARTYITKPHAPTDAWRASNDINSLYIKN